MNPALKTYLTALQLLAGQRIYLVGGAVRDLLTGGLELKDIDLLMRTGSEVAAREFAGRIGGAFFYLDEGRRITRVVKRHEGEFIQFDFTNFEGPDLRADLARRDFTVNAMALDLREFLETGSTENVIDFFNGREDVRNRIIRVAKAEVLIEDPLRLLRAVRFSATLGFAIEDGTAALIRQHASLIGRPAPERVRDEFFLILAERVAEKHLRLLDSLDLLIRLLPELERLRGFAPGRYHVHDVLTHSIKTAGYLDGVLDDLCDLSPEHGPAVLSHLEESLEHFIRRIAALRFACLIHDNAKPETFTDAGGRVRFHDHDRLGAEKAAAICGRFRLSRDTEKAVTKVIRQHMRLFNISAPGGPSRNAMYRYCRNLGDALPESLLLAQADARATSELMPKETFTDTRDTMAAVLSFYYTKFMKAEAAPLVNGDDLIRLGRAPGPGFREILEAVREKQAEGVLKDRQEALDYLKTIT